MNRQKSKIGLIGAGWWATTNHLPILEKRNDIELTSVCRLGKEELKKVSDRFGFMNKAVRIFFLFNVFKIFINLFLF